MSYVYLNKYHRFQKSSPSRDLLDPHTLHLATISLAAKATESPRRLRDIILPAHRLLHHTTAAAKSGTDPSPPPPPPYQPPRPPSRTYDALRATLVQAELILLRTLGFALRAPLPQDFLARYLERAWSPLARDFDVDSWSAEARAEDGAIGAMETRVARGCRGTAVEACKSYQLANHYPARAVALGCVYTTLRAKGLLSADDPTAWVRDIGSGKVDVEDFAEVVEELRRL
ncbi:MAG: hypothetical protein LQ351_001752 [Letrouitia transgressa]|nr:MAG: hypothetical protein LQ351_001752 [Letrouitia transgressa]